MSKTIVLFLLQILMAATLFAQGQAEQQVLEDLLHEFLQAASNNNADMHDRFWAEDLIYTSSNGERVTKTIIMDGLSGADTNTETPKYHAEEIQIRVFDDMAVVAFKLVANFPSANGSEVIEFYNTGTFQKRNDAWKAVAWQATQIPE